VHIGANELPSWESATASSLTQAAAARLLPRGRRIGRHHPLGRQWPEADETCHSPKAGASVRSCDARAGRGATAEHVITQATEGQATSGTPH